MATLIRNEQLNLQNQQFNNLLENSNFINNSTNGYGSTPDNWTSTNANPVQGGFPAMTKQNLIDLLGIADGDIEGLWNLNEASGNATDLSSNGYNLTDTNTVLSSEDGLMGKARDFEKDNSEYFTIASGSSGNLNITSSQTWFCWIKPESLTSGDRIMSKKVNTREIFMTNATQIDFVVAGLTTNSQIYSDVNLEVGKWYFVCGIYDSANSKLKIWVNGIKKEVTASGTATTADTAFEIGRPSATNSNYYDGLIQNAGVLSVALTDSQVKRLFAATTYRGQKIRRATTNASLTQVLSEDKVERLRGKTITLSAQMWQDTASTGTVSIDDGTATASTTTATTGSWVTVNVTKTISATATSITIKLNHSTSDGNTWFKNIMLNASSSVLPWSASPEDWSRFPRLMRMDIPAVINGYSFEEGRWFTYTNNLTFGGTAATNTTINMNRFMFKDKNMFAFNKWSFTGDPGLGVIGFSLPSIPGTNFSAYSQLGTAGFWNASTIKVLHIDQNAASITTRLWTNGGGQASDTNPDTINNGMILDCKLNYEID